MTDVLVVAELLEGKSRKTTLSAVAFAKEATQGGGAFDILAIGEGAGNAAKELAGFGARKVFSAEVGGGYICEKYAPTVAEVANKGGHNVVAATASTYGKDLIPRVAAKLGAGYAGDIIGIAGDGAYRRSLFAGNALATCKITSSAHAVSVRQTEFEAAQPAGGDSPIEEVAVVADAVADKLTFVRLETVKSDRPDLT
jgi:electron transfer flavoprotein alpha subunit